MSPRVHWNFVRKPADVMACITYDWSVVGTDLVESSMNSVISIHRYVCHLHQGGPLGNAEISDRNSSVTALVWAGSVVRICENTESIFWAAHSPGSPWRR